MATVLSLLLWIGLVPGTVAALAMLACRALAVRHSASWAIGVGLGIIGGQIGLSLSQGTGVALNMLRHPAGARDWLIWLMLLAIGISILAAYAPRPWQRAIVLLACVFASTVPLRLLARSVYVTTHWAAATKLFVVAFWGATIFGLWSTLSLGRANQQPWLRAALVVVTALAIPVLIAMSGSLTLAQLAGLAPAALVGAIAGERVFSTRAIEHQTSPHTDPISGAAGPLALFLTAAILLGHFYAELATIPAVMLLAAVAAAGGRLPTNWPNSPQAKAALRTALTLLPLAIALAAAIAAQPDDPYAA